MACRRSGVRSPSSPPGENLSAVFAVAETADFSFQDDSASRLRRKSYKKLSAFAESFFANGAIGESRTRGLPLRRRPLYPSELQPQAKPHLL